MGMLLQRDEFEQGFAPSLPMGGASLFLASVPLQFLHIELRNISHGSTEQTAAPKGAAFIGGHRPTIKSGTARRPSSTFFLAHVCG